MKRLTDWVHEGLRGRLRPGEWAVDATLGNGHDARALLDCVGPTGKVWGFDVQESALEATRNRVGESEAFTPVLASHGMLHEVLPREARGRLAAVLFNLGYLPGGDHALTTKSDTTIEALGLALDWLAPGGILSCLCYPGHEGGREEFEAVAEWFGSLPESVGRVTRMERFGPGRAKPVLFWLEAESSGRGHSTPIHHE